MDWKVFSSSRGIMQTDSDEQKYFGESWTVKAKDREAGFKGK